MTAASSPTGHRLRLRRISSQPRTVQRIHEASARSTQLVREMGRLRPDIPISFGFVDVDVPALPGLVDRVVADSNQAIIVPLLLSSGYHIAVDIQGQASHHPQVQAAAALGPDPVLADILADRLGDLKAIDHVVLAAAGSSNRLALLDCSATAALLADRIDRPVEVGYVSGAGERLAPVLARTPGRVAVATYLLAPGAFADHVRRLAGDRPVSAPLGADSRLAALALARYDAARKLVAVG